MELVDTIVSRAHDPPSMKTYMVRRLAVATATHTHAHTHRATPAPSRARRCEGTQCPKPGSESDRNTGSFTIKWLRKFMFFGENPKMVPEQDLIRVRK